MAARHEPDFIVDATEWQQRWDNLPAFARENAAIQVGQGEVTADPAYAPFALRLALRQRPAVLLWLALPIVAAIAMAAAGLDPESVAVMTGLLILYAGGMAAFFEWRMRAAIARNRAVLSGMDPDEANKSLPAGRGARLVQAVGIFVVSFFIVGLSVRLFILFALAILAMTGVAWICGSRFLRPCRPCGGRWPWC